MIQKLFFAGSGGQGVILMGQMTAYAAMYENKEVTFLPSYGPEMRGGTANCTVVISDKPVSCPLVYEADVVVAMNLPSMLKFQSEVKPGGLLLVNSSIIEEKSNRDDCDVVYVPCNHIAEQIGNPKGANVVFLGAYVAKKPDVIDEETIIEAIRVELGEKKARFLEGNIKALKAGMEYVRNLG